MHAYKQSSVTSVPNNSATIFTFNSRWRRYHDFYRHRIPIDALDWLLEPGSLTQRLIQTCNSRSFWVKLLNENYRQVSLDEAYILGVRDGVRVKVREVLLQCDETPWVYARSLIPVTSLKGRLRRLKQQGNRSLGATLFADRTLRRGPLEIRCVHAAGLPVEASAGTDKTDPVWGRRSIFYLQGMPLLVSEYFLPALFKSGR
ncbi:MAG TPA: chorismate lyase [Gammaproteobacteria bacterium]|jgi:chorismate--pyruvate lyase